MQTITSPVPLSRSTSGWLSTGTRVPNSGVRASPPTIARVALVVGVREQRHARRDQLRARRLDQRLGPVGSFAAEAHAVHRPRALAVLELGLRDRRLEVDVPQRRRLELVGDSAGEQTEERALRDLLRERPDRRVGHRPVDRQAERAPQLFERALVALGEAQAELDEVRARDRDGLLLGGLGGRLEARVVGHRGIAAHAEVVLHAALRRQPVVVPAHRVEDLAALHAHVAGDRVRVRVGEDVPDVQRAADGRRRRVDREDPLARRRAVEGVGALALPGLAPLLLEALQRRALGHLDRLCRSGRGQGRDRSREGQCSVRSQTEQGRFSANLPKSPQKQVAFAALP